MAQVMATAQKNVDWDQRSQTHRNSIAPPASSPHAGAQAPLPNSEPSESANSHEPEITNSSEADVAADSTISGLSAPRTNSTVLQSPTTSLTTNLIADKRLESQGKTSPSICIQLVDETEEHVSATIPEQVPLRRERFAAQLAQLTRRFRPLETANPPGWPQITEPARAVVVSIQEKDKIYAIRGVPGLYVGNPDKIRLPAELVERWEKHTEPRLWTDVQEFQNKMTKSKAGRRHKPGMSLELRMSGYASSHGTDVELVPRIWVLYDHDRWAKETKRFVRETEWLQHEGLGEVEVRKGSPGLATLTPPAIVKGIKISHLQGFPLGQNSHLYLHVERRAGDSAIGLLCCATITKDGTIRGQRVSRLGGLVSFNGMTSLALTTAHGMLELAWDILLDDSSDLDEFSDELGCSSDAGYRSDESSGSDSTAWDDNLPPPMPTFDMDQDREWDLVEVLGVTSFLGNSTLDLSSAMSASQTAAHANTSLSGSREDTDFSLWNTPRSGTLENTYQCPSLKTPVTIRNTFCFFPDQLDDLDSMSVNILLGPDRVVEAHVVPGISRFMVHGKQFTSRKLRMQAPLGPGCSGSWVVKGQSLVGMVIASYEYEPFAHIIACTDSFYDVSSAIAQANNIDFSGKLSPMLWSSWNISAETTRHTERTCGISDLWKTKYFIDAPEPNPQEVRVLVDLMPPKKSGSIWPTTPLAVTPRAFAELRTKLARVSGLMKQLSGVYHLWFSISNDVVRATALANLNSHVADQFSQRVLKRNPSITPVQLDIAATLIDSIFMDLADNGTVIAQLARAAVTEQANSQPPARADSNTVQGIHKRSYPESDCPPTDKEQWLDVMVATKRRKTARDELILAAASLSSDHQGSPTWSEAEDTLVHPS